MAREEIRNVAEAMITSLRECEDGSCMSTNELFARQRRLT